MTIKKNIVRENFTTIPNKLITDKNLSMPAKVLYCYLASKPDDWDIWNADISKALDIKTTNAIAKYLKELIETGWITRENKRQKDGKITGGYDYTINVPNYGDALNRAMTEIGQINNHTNTERIVYISNDINNTDIVTNKKKNNKKKKGFIPPTLEEVEAYCKERKNNVDAKRFFDYYTELNWTNSQGKPVLNWKSTMIANWESKANNTQSPKQKESKPIYQPYEEWIQELEVKQKDETKKEFNGEFKPTGQIELDEDFPW